jgi:hypothetical protein
MGSPFTLPSARSPVSCIHPVATPSHGNRLPSSPRCPRPHLLCFTRDAAAYPPLFSPLPAPPPSHFPLSVFLLSAPNAAKVTAALRVAGGAKQAAAIGGPESAGRLGRGRRRREVPRVGQRERGQVQGHTRMPPGGTTSGCCSPTP